MAEKILTDTSIFIDILRGNENPRLLDKDLVVNAVIHIELLQGASRGEVRHIERIISTYPYHHITTKDSKIAVDLVKQYGPSHHLMLGDALIAATCLNRGYSLLTRNKRDFRYIPGIKLV